MILILYAIVLMFLLSVIIIMVGMVEYKIYIRGLAKRHTYQEINEKIDKDLEEINNANYKGKILENLLDHKELWEQVKEYKRTHF